MTQNPENTSQEIVQERMKRGPAIGPSVMNVSITHSMGFFIFPGFATLLP